VALAAFGIGFRVASQRRASAPSVAAVVPAESAPDKALKPEMLAGAVTPSSGARWRQSRIEGVEVVALDEGTLKLQVRHQVPGERFLVRLPDGELEVRGTTFEVAARGGATTSVQVAEGLVELRLDGDTPLRLAAGEKWARPAQPSSSSAVAATSGSVRVTSAATTSSAASPDAEYAHALSLLRLGRNEDAAAAFDTFVVGHPHTPLAEDASFLEAVALARAGRRDAAALAAQHHLAAFPASFHRKEASILIARAAADRGDCESVRAVLVPWMDSKADDVDRLLKDCGGR
jgi:hypothetical protein